MGFANYCEVSESTMRGYLKGTIKKPRINILQKIAAACNVPWTWLDSDRQPPIPDEWKMNNISEVNLRSFFEVDPEVIDIEDAGDGSIFPVVKAYDDEEIHLLFYCIHCRKWHQHGRGGKNAPFEEGRKGAGGHRITHCTIKNSPYKRKGIILDVVGKFKELENKRKAGKTLFCPKCNEHYSAAFNACECGFSNNKRKSNYPALETFYRRLLNPLTWATVPTNETWQGPKITPEATKRIATNQSSAGNGISIQAGRDAKGNIVEGGAKKLSEEERELIKLIRQYGGSKTIESFKERLLNIKTLLEDK